MSWNPDAPRNLGEWGRTPTVRITSGRDPKVAFLDRVARDGGSVLIRYRNREGIETLRRIHPRYVFAKRGLRGTYVAAWCELRGEERIFRLERMTILDPAPPPRAGPRPTSTGKTRSELVEMVETWLFIAFIYLVLYFLLPWACRILG